MAIILGIDPGLKYTGWGVIRSNNNHLKYVACGRIATDAKLAISERLFTLNQGLKKVIEQYNPDECAIEETFVNKNPLSSLKLGHARGALILTASIAGLTPFEYSATAVKKTVVGVGRAHKTQVIAMMKILLNGAQINSEDAADALAVAVCHANNRVG